MMDTLGLQVALLRVQRTCLARCRLPPSDRPISTPSGRRHKTATPADDLRQIVVQADALLGGFTNQDGMLAPTEAQEDATVRLSGWRTRFATITDRAFSDSGIASL